MNGFDFSGMEYNEKWIKHVRTDRYSMAEDPDKKYELSQEDFAKRVYVMKKNGAECEHVSRNTIVNWERGASLPRAAEPFISIALIEYDKMHGPLTAEASIDSRNERHDYVRALMNHMIGLDLYCRNLQDALLIQISRGLISFKELVGLKKCIEEKLKEIILPQNEKKEYNLARETESIDADLRKIKNTEEFINYITSVRGQYYARAEYIDVERLENTYFGEGRRYGTAFIPYKEAVYTLALIHKNTYMRAGTKSREWLIDICVHLQFNRDEINSVLESTHKALLSDDENHEEYYIRETEYPIGSEMWYFENELKKDRQKADKYTALKRHYDYFNDNDDFSLEYKLKAVLLIANFIRLRDDYLFTIEYFLESFQYNVGVKATNEVDKFIENQLNKGNDSVENWKLRSFHSYDWSRYIDNSEGRNTALSDKIKAEIPKAYLKVNCKNISDDDYTQLCKLHYLSALLYTILSGQYYKGSFNEEDFDKIKKNNKKSFRQEDYNGNEIDELMPEINTILSIILNTFLSGREILRENNKYHLEGYQEGVEGIEEIIFTLFKILKKLQEARTPEG